MCAARKADLQEMKLAVFGFIGQNFRKVQHAIRALKLTYLVSGCDATHWRRASALQTLLDWCAVSVGGLIDGQIFTISCKHKKTEERGIADKTVLGLCFLILTCSSAAIVPQECHSMGARSGTDSLFLLSSRRAFSLVSGLDSSLIHWQIFSLSTWASAVVTA